MISLTIIILLPLIGGIMGYLGGGWRSYREVSLIIVIVEFVMSLSLWVGYDGNSMEYQYVEDWGSILNSGLCHMVLGVDSISIYLIILTTYLTIPILLTPPSKNDVRAVTNYTITILLLEGLTIALFAVLDILIFYILYESLLIPLFLIVGIWGSRERRIDAAYQLFLYTLLGSLFLLIGILVIYNETGTTDYQYSVAIMNTLEMRESVEKVLWILFFVSFGIKIPIYPFHIWLPEAHSEAPTGGSIVLAGLILKLGGYGIIRYLIPLMPNGSVYFTPMVYTIGVVGIIYSSLACIRQVDIKRIIAYSSIAHMNLSMIGLFTNEVEGIMGGVYMMLSHGIVSGSLFSSVGMIYERYKTRVLRYYRGLSIMMPITGTIFMLLTLANIAIPGTSSYVGELLVYMGAFNNNRYMGIIGVVGMILGGVYGIWLCNRMIFGELSKYILQYRDMGRGEIGRMVPNLIIILVMGLYPGEIIGDMILGGSSMIEGSEQGGVKLALVLIGRVKDRGKLVYDIYRNSWLGEAIRDPEGDLMPKSIGRYTDRKIFKYSFVVICVLSLISRWVFRLSKITGLSLYSEVLAIGCTISIMLFYSLVLMKALGVMYTFGNRVVSGYYMTEGGGMGGGERGRRGIMTGAARAAIQAGRAVAGTVITTGALIQGANEIGEAMNRGKMGTEAATKVAKAVGLYKEDTAMAPRPDLPKGSPDGRGGKDSVS